MASIRGLRATSPSSTSPEHGAAGVIGSGGGGGVETVPTRLRAGLGQRHLASTLLLAGSAFFLVLASAIFATTVQSFTWFLLLAGTVAMAGLFTALGMWALLVGIKADGTGVRVVNDFRRQFVPWPEVDAIDVAPGTGLVFRRVGGRDFTAEVPDNGKEFDQRLRNLRRQLLVMRDAAVARPSSDIERSQNSARGSVPPAFALDAPVRSPTVHMPVAGTEHAPTAGPATSGHAIAALTVSVVSGPIGVILGCIALSKIAKTGQNGRGLAISAIAVGLANIIGNVAILALVFSPPNATTELGAVPADAPAGAMLLAALPTTVDAFAVSSSGFARNDAALRSGALEAYDGTFSNGVDKVVFLATMWPSVKAADAAVRDNVALTSPSDAGPVQDVDGNEIGTYYFIEGVGQSFIIWTNDTLALQVTGSPDAVWTFFANAPL